ncbi:glycerophosphodiester phosphodiesterase family protein [Rhodopirellula sp.]|jgi:glycerophosphoryl diester phosphodiesterase|nr:glycerophosphodiester phosphodiesterase family protein [Rhodopirellula sp.]
MNQSFQTIARLVLSGIAITSQILTQPHALSADNANPSHRGITAHRGNSGMFPENTLPAFENAIELGVDWIELDLFLTKDQQLVVIHDQTTERTGNRALDVTKSTLQEIQSVDVANDFRNRHKLSISDCPPQHVPQLEDVLNLVMRQNRTRVSIQPKVDCVAKAVEVIQKMGAENLVGFNDGNLKLMIKAKQLAPDATIFWDRGVNTNINEDIQTATQYRFHALIYQDQGISLEKINRTKMAGLNVGAWTVNDPDRIRELLRMGVNRIYTDYPQRMIKIIQEENRPERQ